MFEQDVQTTLYAQGTAFELILGLLILGRYLRKKKETEGAIFFGLCLVTCGLIACGVAEALLAYRTFYGAKLLAMLAYTAEQLLQLLFILQWLAFVDFKLYKSKDQLIRRYRPALIGVAVLGVMFFINFFTGIIFTLDAHLLVVDSPLGYILSGFEIVVLTTTGVMLYRFRKNHRAPTFLRILPFMVPLFAGIVSQEITPYNTLTLGMSVGLVLLHFSLMNERIYLDENTGFYNEAFLRYANRYTKQQGLTGGTLIFFESDEKTAELAAILSREKPQNCEVVALSDGRFLLISETQQKMVIELLIDNIKAAAMEQGILCGAGYSRRKDGESPEAFFQRAMLGKA